MKLETKTITKTKNDEIEFVPLGAQQSIRLSLAIVKMYVCIPTKSGQICSDRDAMRFMMLCRSRALNPFEGDAYLQGYDTKNGPEFSLITAHQAFLKRAELHPDFDGKTSGVIVKTAAGNIEETTGDFILPEDTLLGGWCTVYFKTRKWPQKERLNLSAYDKGYSRWTVDPAGMIVKCAEAAAMRSAFPTQLSGMYLREEYKQDDFEFPAAAHQLPGAEEQQQNGGDSVSTPDKPSQQATPPLRAQDAIMAKLSEAGLTFQDLQKWGEESGNIPDASSLPDSDSIPDDIAKRLLRPAIAGSLAETIQRFKGFKPA